MGQREERQWLYDKLKESGVYVGSSLDEFDKLRNNQANKKWYADQIKELGLDYSKRDSGTGDVSPQRPVEDQTEAVRKPTLLGNARDWGAESLGVKPVLAAKDPYSPAAPRGNGDLGGVDLQSIAPKGSGIGDDNERLKEREDEISKSLEENSKSQADIEKNEGMSKWEQFVRIVGGNAPRPQGVIETPKANEERVTRQKYNEEKYGEVEDNLRQLKMEERAIKKERRKIEIAQRNENRHGFWENAGGLMLDPYVGAFDKLTNVETYSFGLAEMAEARELTRISKKVEAGEELTEKEHNMLAAVAGADKTDAIMNSEGGPSPSMLYGWGEIFGESVPFMIEMALSGGTAIAGKVASVSGKAAARIAAKQAMKRAAKQGAQMSVQTAARKALTNPTMMQKAIQYTGTALGEFAVGAYVGNTTGAAGTWADIEKRRLGSVMEMPDGSYAFGHIDDDGKFVAGGESFGSAFFKGQMASAIENYTELLGGHMAGAANKLMAKGANKIGLSTLGDMFSRQAQMGAGKLADITFKDKLFSKVAFNGYIGESLEEEAGIVLNSLIVGDNKFSDLWDPRTQADIWGGMIFSTGAMEGGGWALNKASRTIGYHNARKGMSDAEAIARMRLTEERWKPLQERIINTPNQEIKGLVADVVSDETLQDAEKIAALDYIGALVKFRGYNQGSMIAAQDKQEYDSKGQPVASEATRVERTLDAAYNNGYEGMMRPDMVTRQAIRAMGAQNMDEAQERYDQWLDGKTPQERMAQMRAEGADAKMMDDAMQRATAMAGYKGMQQAIEDEADTQDKARRELARNASHTDGSMRKVTLKDGSQVYIVAGGIVRDSNGVIDKESSSEVISVYDPESGNRWQTKPSDVESVDDYMTPEQVEADLQSKKEQSLQAMRERAEGKVSLQPGATVNVGIDENGNYEQVRVVGTDGANVTVIDAQGNSAVVPVSQLQAMSDAVLELELLSISKARQEESKEQNNADATPTDEGPTAAPGEGADARQTAESAGMPIAPGAIAEEDEVVVRLDNGLEVRGMVVSARQDGSVKIAYKLRPNEGLKYVVIKADEIGERIVSHKPTEPPTPTSIEPTTATPAAATEKSGDERETGDNLSPTAADNGQPAEMSQQAQEQAGESVPISTENATLSGEKIENSPISVQNVQESVPTEVTSTPLQRVPKDANGNPIFEQADSPETAWDALVEYSEGDAATAKEIADAMVEEKKKAYEKAQKLKLKGKTPAEMLASKKANAEELAKSQAEYEHWQKMAGVEQRRIDAERSARETEARKAAEERAAAEAEERAAREEAERIEREALNGVPEWHQDTPENARKRGFRRYNGQKWERQEPLQGVGGKEVEVKFSSTDLPKGRVVVIEAEQLQPSHMQGERNPLFFIEEAQPKNRTDAVSMMAAKEMADGIRPEEITGSATAYTGAPTVNTRGEVIQGNNRSDALRYLWDSGRSEQQDKYKQYLIDNAERFGIDPEAVAQMKHPVLVNMLDVEDAEAIRLGQLTAQDTESGGVERIKAKNVAQKLGERMRDYANRIMRSEDEEATFGQLVDRNGADVLGWLNQIGAITPTQYQSAFDSKGNITAEAKNDLSKVLYQAVFKGANQQLEELFEKLPAKAQRAILSTAFRDLDSPFSQKMLGEIQASVRAFDELMRDENFAKAKNLEEVMRTVQVWAQQTALDDRFEQVVPADNYSNFALRLAAMYKAGDFSQRTLAATFNEMYDLIQGTVKPDLFNPEPDSTPRTLADAIKEVLKIDYQQAKNDIDNGRNGSADVAVGHQASEAGQPRIGRDAASGEHVEGGEESAERGGRAASDSGAAAEQPAVSEQGKGAATKAAPGVNNSGAFAALPDATLQGMVRNNERELAKLPADSPRREALQRIVDTAKAELAGRAGKEGRKHNLSDEKKAAPTTSNDADKVKDSTEAIADFARALGRKVTYEGDFEGSNERGYVEDGVIHINPNMNAAEQAAFVLGHEFAHTLEGSEEYDALVDYIKGSELMKEFLHKRTEQLREQGSWKLTRDMTFEDLIEYTQRLYKSSGHELTSEEVEQEIVADFVSDEVLSDEKRLEEFIKNAPGARSIFQRILDAITKFIRKVTGHYSEMETLRDKLQRAINASMEWTREDGTRMFNLTTIDKTTAAADKYMRKQEVPKDERERVIAELRSFAQMAQELDQAKDESGNWKFPLFNAWNVKSIEVDEKGVAHVTCVVKNAEYTMNIDFSTICKKRKNLDALLNALAADDEFSIEGLMPEDIAEMNKIIKAHGLEIACGLCFVDAKRYNIASWARTFAEPYNDMLRALTGKSEKHLGELDFAEEAERQGKTARYKENWAALDELGKRDARYQTKKNEKPTGKPNDLFTNVKALLGGRLRVTASKDNSSGFKISIVDEVDPALAEKARHFLNAKDLLSSQGFDGLKETFPELYAISFTHQGTAKPKTSHTEVPYNGEIVSMTQFKPDAAYNVGGVRNQSFSDFVAHMVFDYVQMYGDLAAKGLPLQAYTKEMAYARLFGQTGAKINMSALHTVDAETKRAIDEKYPKETDKDGRIQPIPNETKETDADLRRVGLDSEGNYVRNDESVNIDEAIALQQTPGYDGNIGIIVVGLSYDHIMKLMADPNARMIIPYHASGINSNVAAVVDARYYTDYTTYQNTCDSQGKKVEKDYCNFNKRMMELEAKHKPGTAGWDRIPQMAAEEYVRECEAKGHRPKFPQFAYIINDGTTTVRYENGKPVNVEMNEDGKPKVREQYYKTLEDFSVYNSRGEYCPQGAVKMNFAEEMRVGDELPNSARHGERVSMKEYIGEMLTDEQQNRDRLDKELAPIKDEVKKTVLDSKKRRKRKYSIMGEQGAANLDASEEATTRMNNLDVARQMEARFKEIEGSEEHKRMVEAAEKVRGLEAVTVKPHTMDREQQKAMYQGFKRATNNQTGVTVEFFSSAFEKNHRDGGLFEKAIPGLKAAFEDAVLISSEADNRAGEKRPDGTTHKKHPSVQSFDDYVGKLEIDGKEYYVRYTVQVQKGQNGIHSQFVSNIDLYNAKNPNSGLSYRDSSLAARGTADGIVDSKLRNFFILANGDAKSFAQRLKYATGWELGADGKWRYEVHGYGIEEAVDNWRMGILKHHLTDKAYDELQSITDSKGRHDAIKEHALNALAFPVL